MKTFRLLAFAAAAIFASGCASTKAPSVRVAGLGFRGVNVGGAGVDVALQLRNVNPEELRIERFEYELKLNGKTLGRGFGTSAVTLGGFAEERVTTRLDVNLLRLPGAVRSSLERDRVDAQVKGTFYVRDGNSLRKLKFGTRGSVNLDRDSKR
jgi:LEA14-like dessication related protein